MFVTRGTEDSANTMPERNNRRVFPGHNAYVLKAEKAVEQSHHQKPRRRRVQMMLLLAQWKYCRGWSIAEARNNSRALRLRKACY